MTSFFPPLHRRVPGPVPSFVTGDPLEGVPGDLSAVLLFRGRGQDRTGGEGDERDVRGSRVGRTAGRFWKREDPDLGPLTGERWGLDRPSRCPTRDSSLSGD